MIDAAEILDALVERLRDTPDVVSLMDGDPERIRAYHDMYPNQNSLQEEIAKGLEAPGILCYWQATGPGAGGFEPWQHVFGIAIRMAAELNTGATPQLGYSKIFRAIMKGLPATGEQQPLIYATIHPQCLPFLDSTWPSISRATDVAGIDYFVIQLSFTENGEN